MAIIEYIEFNTAPLPLGPEMQALVDANSTKMEDPERGPEPKGAAE